MTLLETLDKTSSYGESIFNGNVLIKKNVSYSKKISENIEKTSFFSLKNCLAEPGDQEQQASFSNVKQSITTWLVHEKTKEMIFEQLHFPSDWELEEVEKPNLISKKTALDVCESLLENYSLIPDKISPTKEEGIYVRFDYRSGKIKKSLIIEFYNTLEIAAIVTNNETKDVEFSFDIERRQFKNAIESLKKIS